MKTDQFEVEIVVFSDKQKEENYSRINIVFNAETIEKAIVMAVDMLDTNHICKHYTIVKVRNHSVA